MDPRRADVDGGEDIIMSANKPPPTSHSNPPPSKPSVHQRPFTSSSLSKPTAANPAFAPQVRKGGLASNSKPTSTSPSTTPAPARLATAIPSVGVTPPEASTKAVKAASRRSGLVPFALPSFPLFLQANTSSTSLAPSTAEGKPILVVSTSGSASTAEGGSSARPGGASALREISSQFPAPPRPRRLAPPPSIVQVQTAEAKSSVVSRPVIVRTYSSQTHSRQGSRHGSASGSRGSVGSRRPYYASSGAGSAGSRYGIGARPPTAGGAAGGEGSSSGFSAFSRYVPRGAGDLLRGMGRSSYPKKAGGGGGTGPGAQGGLEGGISAAMAAGGELKTPSLEAFSFKGIMAEIDVGSELDRIAEICARSRYSLSNQYEVHVAPHGSGTAFLQSASSAGGGPNAASSSASRRSGAGPGPLTLQAVSSDDENGAQGGGAGGPGGRYRRRRGGGRRRSAAMGTLETIMSSSRSSEEDKAKKKSAAELVDEVRGRAGAAAANSAKQVPKASSNPTSPTTKSSPMSPTSPKSPPATPAKDNSSPKKAASAAVTSDGTKSHTPQLLPSSPVRRSMDSGRKKTVAFTTALMMDSSRQHGQQPYYYSGGGGSRRHKDTTDSSSIAAASTDVKSGKKKSATSPSASPSSSSPSSSKSSSPSRATSAAPSALVSEPALPQTSSSHLEIRTTNPSGQAVFGGLGEGTSSAGGAARNGSAAAAAASATLAAGAMGPGGHHPPAESGASAALAILDEPRALQEQQQLQQQQSQSDVAPSVAAGLLSLSGIAAWIAWRSGAGTGSVGVAANGTEGPDGRRTGGASGTNPNQVGSGVSATGGAKKSQAEGSLRELLRSAESKSAAAAAAAAAAGDAKGKAVDRSASPG